LELLSYYGVDYVYLGAAEREQMRADVSFFETNFPAAYRGAGVTIYDARRGRVVGDDGADAYPARTLRAVRLPPRELSARVGRDPFALLEEFPRTSLFVYRILKAARGRAPRREEFMASLRVLGSGLYVGADGWEKRLVENRRALAAQLAPGDGSRAAALLASAEDPTFDAREYDAAFVLMHFFGYLGRDPGDPPDRDLSGFDYWLDVLARNRDYRSLSRAFLESDEYRNRRVEP
jgi:preprotein translocase subunit Sss1